METFVTDVDDEQLKAEKSLLEENILGKYTDMITEIVTNSDKFGDSLLRDTSVLTLGKFMCVSSNYCEKNLPILFNILKGKLEKPMMRANIIIILGDLSLRFPNLLQNNIDDIYDKLLDDDLRIRKNTLMVLTHLLLNDMIKAKGKISNMALCLEDKDRRIKELASLFFHQLSTKGNTLYNTLPDIIFNLSTYSSETTFKNIMKILFSLIDKEKQVESLISKLCQRMQQTDDTLAWQRIMYCIGLLNITDKAFKKFSECFRFYKDALGDQIVCDTINVILDKIKASTKGDLKTMIDELEEKIKKYKEQLEIEKPIESKKRKRESDPETKPNKKKNYLKRRRNILKRKTMIKWMRKKKKKLKQMKRKYYLTMKKIRK